MKKSAILAVLLLLFTLLASCTADAPQDNSPTIPNPGLKVTFIDVGQGDSILVECGKETMLIDAGTTESAQAVVSALEKENIKKIGILVGTHPHEDHIGSMDTVIQRFGIGQVYMPKTTADTQAFRDVIKALKNKSLTITSPVPGSGFRVGTADCTILAPNSGKYEETNDYSIVLRLVFGKTRFLFTGDAQKTSEAEILEKGYDVKADVLKVGHHGSSSSTTAAFLDAVSPQYAVISCGKGNDYKHPHGTTLNKLKKRNIPVFRTDEEGTVVCTSDGTNLKFNVEPGSYRSGSTRK